MHFFNISCIFVWFLNMSQKLLKLLTALKNILNFLLHWEIRQHGQEKCISSNLYVTYVKEEKNRLKGDSNQTTCDRRHNGRGDGPHTLHAVIVLSFTGRPVISALSFFIVWMHACLSLGTGQRASGGFLGLSPRQPLLSTQSPNTSQISFDLESDVRFERRPRYELHPHLGRWGRVERGREVH